MPSPRLILVLAGLVGAALLAAGSVSMARDDSAASGEDASAGARVLLVDMDDVGHDLVELARTPHLDALRAEGRFFTTLVTAPTCSPSRAMLHTGARCSHPNVLFGRVLRAKYKGSQAYELPTEPLVPMAALVAASGRKTAKIGKWHLAQASAPDHPERCGWQSYRGVMANLKVGKSTYEGFAKVTDGESAEVEGQYLTSVETDDAIAAVRAGVDLVSLSYHAPHKPWHRPPSALLSEESRAAAEKDDLGEVELAALMLEACDHELGRLLVEAKKQGYTVLVFGDNGGQNSVKEAGGKGTFLESGIVVPMWAAGPGVTPGVDTSIISMVDFYATVAELFGIERDVKLQGPHSISFAGALKGKPHKREWAYSEIFNVLGEDPRSRMNIQWQRAVRGPRFKLFENRGGRHMTLVDLASDPYETKNLLDTPPLSQEALDAYNAYREFLTRL